MKLPIPASPVDPPHLTRFHHRNDEVSYYRTTFLPPDLGILYRHSPPDRLKSRIW